MIRLKFKWNEEERDIKKLKDLEGLTTDQARDVLQKMGATFEQIPDVDLGNLRYPDNMHAPWMVSKQPVIHKRTEKGFTAVLGGGYDSNLTIGSSLVVKSMNKEESMKNYVNFLKDDHARMTDEQLLKWNPYGRKAFARARDECLRRKLINKVGE